LIEQILSTFKFKEEAEINPETGWKIFRETGNRFQFEYPSIYTRDLTSDTFKAKTDTINILIVGVSNKLFGDYSYTALGGTTYSFDVETNQWDTPGFTKVNASIEAYKIGFVDAGCVGDIVVIPHPTYSYVVEVHNLWCQNIATEGQIPPAVQELSTEDFLKTFTFL